MKDTMVLCGGLLLVFCLYDICEELNKLRNRTDLLGAVSHGHSGMFGNEPNCEYIDMRGKADAKTTEPA